MMTMGPPHLGQGCAGRGSVRRSSRGSQVSAAGSRHGRVQQGPGLGEVGGAIAVGEKTIMADAMEALGEHVHQEAADELVVGQRLIVP